jgi:DNA primase
LYPAVQSREFRDFVERVKLRSPIELIVGERVPDLVRRGSAWKARCPFHDEKTPSFVVNAERGTWKCFGACSEGGDVISFVQRFEGLSFYEALRLLAQACGETPPAQLGQRGEHGGEDPRMTLQREALERAQRLYARLLHQPEGAEALAYARGRGLSDATLSAFGVGFAPRFGSPLVDAARQAHFSEEALLEAGLVRRSDEGRLYDFFRGRLLIPIRDQLGRTVGFGGRTLPGDDEPAAKYVNTAETPLFKKSRLIYGFDRALPLVRRAKHLILMEGYTDVMAAHQVGLLNAAAVLGTATTEDHAALVRRSGARRVTLVFDGDSAGLRAGLRAVPHLLPLGLELEVVLLPAGKDPCDLCLELGLEGFSALLAGARDWFDHALELLRGLSGPRLAEEVDELLKLLLLVRPVERDLRVAQMARFLGVPEEGIRDQGRVLAQRRRPAPAEPAPGSRAPAARPGPVPVVLDPRLRAAFEALLGCALLDNSLIPSLRARRAICPPGGLDRIFDAVLELWDEGDDEAAIDDVLVLNALGDDPARDLVVPLVERAATAESPQVLARDQLRWLERRERESEVGRRLAVLQDGSGLDDAHTRDALRHLHEELRGIKVPKAPATLTPPTR